MKLPVACYHFFEATARVALVIQVRDPITRELVDAADLRPYRAQQKIGSPIGLLPAGGIMLITQAVAAPLIDRLEPLPTVAGVRKGLLVAAAEDGEFEGWHEPARSRDAHGHL